MSTAHDWVRFCAHWSAPGLDLDDIEPNLWLLEHELDERPLARLPRSFVIPVHHHRSRRVTFVKRRGQVVEIATPVLLPEEFTELAARHGDATVDAAISRAIRWIHYQYNTVTDRVLDRDDWSLRTTMALTWPSVRMRFPTRVGFSTAFRQACAVRRLTAYWTNRILAGANSVLLLGYDSSDGLRSLRAMQKWFSRRGWKALVVKELPDEAGETVMGKVQRFAAGATFILVENSVASGHLYEFPHVAKMSDSPVSVLQRRDSGATWMFEDAFHIHRNWRKIEYTPDSLHAALGEALCWALGYRRELFMVQRERLPWWR